MKQTRTFQLQMPTPVEFGVGVAGEVGRHATRLGICHALLVTDRGLADSPACTATQAALQASGVAVTLFADVEPDPPAASIATAVAAYRAAAADGLVALGGGSAMDTAKALGVLAVAGGDDIVPFCFGGDRRISGIPPLICLPTTAGTGAEVTFVSIVTHEQQKKLLRDPSLAPALALVDPQLTVSMPAALTAATGMDALAHSLEALTSTLANPLCDTLALDAIGRIGRWLPVAFEQPENLAARSELSLAALAAGLAFLNARVHLGHAIGHSLGTHYHIAHGFACAMCMPALLTFLQPVCEPQLERVAAALGGADAAAAVADLMQRTATPGLGAAANVTVSDIPRLVEIVQTEQRLINLSPRQPTAADWQAIFTAAL